MPNHFVHLVRRDMFHWQRIWWGFRWNCRWGSLPPICPRVKMRAPGIRIGAAGGEQRTQEVGSRKLGDLVVLGEVDSRYGSGVNGPLMCELWPRYGWAIGYTLFRQPPKHSSHDVIDGLLLLANEIAVECRNRDIFLPRLIAQGYRSPRN